MSSNDDYPKTTTMDVDDDLDDSDDSVYAPEDNKKTATHNYKKDDDPLMDDDSDVIDVDDDAIVNEDVQCRLCNDSTNHAMSEISAIATSIVHMAGQAIGHISSIARGTKNNNPKKEEEV
jgi:hypothetical protein